jgi:hypothetical protein
MRKSNRTKTARYLPIEQFLLITAPASRGPDPVAPMMLAAAALLCAFTALLAL